VQAVLSDGAEAVNAKCLGAAFVDAVRAATTRWMESPQAVAPGPRRRYLMGRFPFAVVYRELAEDDVEIVAVPAHNAASGMRSR
jgi:hypothetical protein